jgi:hypothetical protein
MAEIGLGELPSYPSPKAKQTREKGSETASGKEFAWTYLACKKLFSTTLKALTP